MRRTTTTAGAAACGGQHAARFGQRQRREMPHSHLAARSGGTRRRLLDNMTRRLQPGPGPPPVGCLGPMSAVAQARPAAHRLGRRPGYAPAPTPTLRVSPASCGGPFGVAWSRLESFGVRKARGKEARLPFLVAGLRHETGQQARRILRADRRRPAALLSQLSRSRAPSSQSLPLSTCLPRRSDPQAPRPSPHAYLTSALS